MHVSLHFLQRLGKCLISLLLDDVASKNQKENIEIGRLVVSELDQAVVHQKRILFLKANDRLIILVLYEVFRLRNGLCDHKLNWSRRKLLV